MALSTTEEIIEDMRQGKMVILMDDEDRENEGDLIIPAQKVTPEAINFMATHGRGLICMTMTEERCKQLNLPLMVANNTDAHGTNFTVSIEASKGVTTGISAADRATTVLAAIGDDAKPDDIVMPGHIFPLKAQPGGVLTRAGHTEAGCDLAKLAGCSASSVIVEILNEDGTMARRDDLEIFAKKHDIKMGTIADLIHYRIENEKTVERMEECNMPTAHGDFRLISYLDAYDKNVHMALVYGEPDMTAPVLVRVHMLNSLCDSLGGKFSDCSHTLDMAMQRIVENGSGVVVVLRSSNDSDTILQHIKNYNQQQSGVNLPQQTQGDLRTFGLGAQILVDLGVSNMQVLGSKVKLHGLSGFGLEISDYVSFE